MLGLAEIEAALAPFAIRCGQQEKMVPPLMERALAEDFPRLPAAWKRLAEIHDIDSFAGDASVERGQGLASRLVGSLFGFPPATNAVTVEVTKQKTAKGERWIRRFGDRSFVSHLSLRHDDAPGMLRERFGLFSFALRLRAKNCKVHWPVEKWTALGVPMPRWLMPKSETVEFVDVPLVGRAVRYRGWLTPADDCLSQTRGIGGSPDFSPTAAKDPPPLQTGRRFGSAQSQTSICDCPE